MDHVQIVFDPLFESPFSRNCFAYPAVQFDEKQIRQLKLNAVFISHFHDDHCSLESLNQLNRETPIYLFCGYAELFALIRELGFKNVHALKIDETVQIHDFKVTVHRALDTDVDCIFQIQCLDLQILNVVDSWIDDDVFATLKKVKWDLVLWPFQTMQEIEVLQPSRSQASDRKIPLEWQQQIQELKPKYLIPSSCQFIHEEWSWYRWAYFPISYYGFSQQILKISPETEVLRLDPAQGLRVLKTEIARVQNLSWIQTLSADLVDYEYDFNRAVPTTSEIAKKFPQLTFEQRQRVLDFCKIEILKNPAHHEEGSYFFRPRTWRLSLYDQDGSEENFDYLVGPGQIKAVPLCSQYHWRTEIPHARLYGALEQGESLSSLYLRVNDEKFSFEVEKKLKEADLFEDPLLHSLFSRNPCSYQKAQLRRIKALS